MEFQFQEYKKRIEAMIPKTKLVKVFRRIRFSWVSTLCGVLLTLILFVIKDGLGTSVNHTKPEKRQLLLVTKGRSGSSFTSALINNDQHVFYTFEPLYVFVRLPEAERLNFVYRQKKAYALLKAFLECDFSEVTGEDIGLNSQIRHSSSLSKEFFRCMRLWDFGSRHLDCLFKLLEECKEKTVSFAKVIRFPMKWAGPILERLPSLKILYLIRDPRAVLKSQASVFKSFNWPQDLELASESYCENLEEDIAAIERLQVQFPGRVRVAKFEHGITETTEYAKHIYNFAGLEFTEKTKDHIEYLNNPTTQNPLIGTQGGQHSNVYDAIHSWRYTVDFDTIKRVDKLCANVYEKMGYKSVTSQRDLKSERELFDLDVPINRM